MARSLWNGVVSVGLVHVPVKLYSAVEPKTVHFREVHLADRARIEHRRFCAKEDREVPYEEVVKGFEVAAGEYVVLEKDDLAAAAGSRSHSIEVEDFVCADDIDPVFYERSYYLGAQDDAGDAYRLLHDALAGAARAAVGRFTFRNREYLTAIRPLDGVLALHTLRFADELVPSSEFEYEAPQRAPSEREVKMARQLVETLHEEFRPERYEDEYRRAVLAVVERKAAGRPIEPPSQPEPEEAPDLTAALQASLEAAESRG